MRVAVGAAQSATPGTPPPFSLPAMGSAHQQLPIPQALQADTIIEAAKQAAAKEAAEEAALSNEQQQEPPAAGIAGAPPLPPAHVIEALARPDAADPTAAAATAMEADSCLKRAAEEATNEAEAAAAAEAKRPREH
eukprot:6476223-Amphidinium_carterae.3